MTGKSVREQFVQQRRSDYDVTNTVQISSPVAVCDAVCEILEGCYPGIDLAPVHRAFETFTRGYAGILDGFHGCDTWYHDVQHSLDCTLAMARLVDGYDRHAAASAKLGPRRAVLGVISALFHDAGYLRRWSERQFHKGAEFTLYHVSRSGDFLAEFLPTVGFKREAELARRIVHYTGYEIALDRIPVRGKKDRQVGYMLGSADLLSQLSDRCYPEKCFKFLYHEFETCGIAGKAEPGVRQPMYSSADDLLRKTPGFIDKLFAERLDGHFQSVRRNLDAHFRWPDPYVAQIRQHLDYIAKVIATGDRSLLRRQPRSVNGRRVRQLLGIRLSDDAPEHRALMALRTRTRARHVPGKRRASQYVPV
jgi:hypothetical protein